MSKNIVPYNDSKKSKTAQVRDMFDNISRAFTHGICGNAPWGLNSKIRFLCPVPGYDRHFAMTDGQEDYTCSGEALRSGIPLSMQYCGTGYHPDLRLLGDWGSSLYVAEETE